MTGRLPTLQCPLPDARFWAKVDKGGPGGCWLWTGCTDLGYGRVNRNHVSYRAHRLTYVAAHGEPATDLVIDHLCRVRNCVNPAHLEAVSMKENLMRGDCISTANSLAETCPYNHPYAPGNTYNRPGGSRVCRTCKNIRRRIEKRRARDRQRLGLGPGRPGRPSQHSAAQAAHMKVGV